MASRRYQKPPCCLQHVPIQLPTLCAPGSLGEHKIRDLNDFINKLLREKKHWERQIKFLGGVDYMVCRVLNIVLLVF